MEAIRDGRVAGAERTSFERHLGTCSRCRDHSRSMQQSLERLAALPSGIPDAFTLRRERRALLRAFDSSLLARSEAPDRWRLRLAFACAVLSAALLVTLFSAHRVTRDSSWVKVAAGADASWSEHRTGEVEQITLRTGRFQLSIHRPSSSARVTIVLPDGEIEDLGTELAVSIDGDRTSHVAVDRGSVVLKLRGVPETRLAAGDHWDRPADVAKPVLTPAVSGAKADQRANEATASGVTRQNAKPKSAGTLVNPLAKKSPIDPGAAQVASEDAAYLHVLALLEAGQRDHARAAANQYLNDYPHGFRRLEALSIATRPSPLPRR